MSKVMQHAKYQYIQVSDVVANPVVSDDVLGFDDVRVLVVRGVNTLRIVIVIPSSDQPGDGVDIGVVNVRQRRGRSYGRLDEFGDGVERACIASSREQQVEIPEDFGLESLTERYKDTADTRLPLRTLARSTRSASVKPREAGTSRRSAGLM
jgi:hypothetical protein